MHAAMVLLVLLIGIVMLKFWRGLSCVQPLLYASLAVCTSLLWHWMLTALCGLEHGLYLQFYWLQLQPGLFCEAVALIS